MGNEKNLIPFSARTKEEARELGAKGGKKSGEMRRKKANFKKTLNMLLTTQIEVDAIKDFLEGNGIDSTYESAINFAIIQEALNGNVKAFLAIRDTIGQSKPNKDVEEQKARIALLKSKMQSSDKTELAEDGFLEALNGSAKEDWSGMEDEET